MIREGSRASLSTAAAARLNPMRSSTPRSSSNPPSEPISPPSKRASITPHTQFKAEVYVLSKDEGGRHTPFFNNYRPQFYFRTTDVTGSIKLPEGQEMVMPGDNTNMEIEMIQPIAMEEGLQFAIREGGRTVGAGQVTKIVK